MTGLLQRTERSERLFHDYSTANNSSQPPVLPHSTVKRKGRTAIPMSSGVKVNRSESPRKSTTLVQADPLPQTSDSVSRATFCLSPFKKSSRTPQSSAVSNLYTMQTSRQSIAYAPVPLCDPTPFSDSILSDAFSDAPLFKADVSSPVPPSYNDVSGPVIINAQGQPQFLTPEEEVERQQRLQTAVREKMLGLPRTTTFEWHQGPSAFEEPQEMQLPPYTPKEEKK